MGLLLVTLTLLSLAAEAANKDPLEAARARIRARFPDPPPPEQKAEKPLKIITKHHFMRERKSSLVPIPKPFVVSTELNVRLPGGHGGGGRRGRTCKAHDGATVIEGEIGMLSRRNFPRMRGSKSTLGHASSRNHLKISPGGRAGVRTLLLCDPVSCSTHLLSSLSSSCTSTHIYCGTTYWKF